MQTKIHPKWYPEAKVTCACGNTFTMGATFPELTVEICSNCHPFYTGQMKFTGAKGRVETFRTKQEQAKKKVLSKTQKQAIKKAKRIKKKYEGLESLEELRHERR